MLWGIASGATYARQQDPRLRRVRGQAGLPQRSDDGIGDAAVHGLCVVVGVDAEGEARLFARERFQ